MTRATRFGLIAFLFVTPARQVWAQPPSPLVWGCDPEGGAPYVEADPADPSRLVGFEVDIANLVAAHLHRQPRFHAGKDLREKPYVLFRVRVDGHPVLLTK